MSTSKHNQVQSPFAKKSPIRGEYQPPSHLIDKIETPVQQTKAVEEPAITGAYTPKPSTIVSQQVSPLGLIQSNNESIVPSDFNIDQITEMLNAKGFQIAAKKVQWRKFSIETKEDTAALFDEMVKMLGMKKKVAYETMFSDFIKKHKADFEKIKLIRKE